MKTSVILCLVFAYFQIHILTVSARAIHELDEDEEACIKKLHLNTTKIQILNSHEITPENDTDFNNFIGCCWNKAGLQTPSGDVDYDGLKEVLEFLLSRELADESFAVKLMGKQMLSSAIDDCHERLPTGKTFGQTAVKVQNCVMRKLNELMMQ